MIVVSRKWFRVGMIVVNNDSGFGALEGPKPQFSGLFVTPMRARGGGGGGAGSDRKTLVLELWEAQNLNSQVFLSLPCGPGGGGQCTHPKRPTLNLKP